MKEVPQLVIGSIIRITKAKNKSLRGMGGKVIDETKNLLIIETRKGIKKIIKEQIEFKIENERKEEKGRRKEEG
ncbi:MAG: ribonuclease P protein subunit [Candidatus Pacearchaeota archaeon]|nr:MAG: ribonuclease P protein subunit [Candidatus Pacearchaeota archaeon]